jgi:hypothetical protein
MVVLSGALRGEGRIHGDNHDVARKVTLAAAGVAAAGDTIYKTATKLLKFNTDSGGKNPEPSFSVHHSL